MKFALGGLALVLTTVTACGGAAAPRADRTSDTEHGSSSGPRPTPASTTPTGGPTQATATLREARRAWDSAAVRVVRAGSGTYTWTVNVTQSSQPLERETGVYAFHPMRTSFERVITGPGADAHTYTLRARRSHGVSYMQMADWGAWDGCWLRFTNDAAAQQFGVDLSASPDLPVGVAVPLNSTVTRNSGYWFGAPSVEYTAEVTAVEALQFLGVSARNLIGQETALTRAKAPIVVSIDEGGRVHGAGARGSDVAAALRAAHIELSEQVRQALPSMTAYVKFSNPGAPAAVAIPPARSVLPEGAGKNDTCRAQR